jgi:hypothetical protein
VIYAVLGFMLYIRDSSVHLNMFCHGSELIGVIIVAYLQFRTLVLNSDKIGKQTILQTL